MSEKILGTGKLSIKGQVTVPIDARKKFDLSAGNLIIFFEKNGELVIRKG